MTKSEIIAAIAATYGMTTKEVEITINRFLSIIVDELEESGGPVKIHGFGRFEVKEMTRVWKNPKNGIDMGESLRRRVSFTPSEVLRDRLNPK